VSCWCCKGRNSYHSTNKKSLMCFRFMATSPLLTSFMHVAICGYGPAIHDSIADMGSATPTRATQAQLSQHSFSLICVLLGPLLEQSYPFLCRVSHDLNRYCIFFQNTAHSKRLHTHTHTHPYGYKLINASLSTDTSLTTEIIAPVEFWNKFRKIRTPVSSRELESKWAGSTVKKLTS
jgi:hypothetical protein